MKFRGITAVFLASLALTACNDVRSMLGMNHRGPDEYRVVTRPPLEIPPEYTLRPPLSKESEVSNGSLSASSEGRQLLLGKEALSDEGKAATSKAEARLLSRAGTEEAEPGIRTIISEESKEIAAEQKEKKGWFSDMFSFGNDDDDAVLDPVKESERLGIER